MVVRMARGHLSIAGIVALPAGASPWHPTIGAQYLVTEGEMPIHAVIENEAAFTSADAVFLISAFNVTIQKLGLVDRDDPLILMVAEKIIAIAKQGERDPEKLSAATLAALGLEPAGKTG